MDMMRRLEGVTGWSTDAVAAKQAWAEYRGQHGFKAVYVPLLTPPSANSKLYKSARPTYGLALAQADTSGHNVCRWSTPECRAVCVSTAGNGNYPSVQRARVAKTGFLFDFPHEFYGLVLHEVERAVRKHGGGIVLRLNTFSDLPWEQLNPLWVGALRVAGAELYDYTKNPHRLEAGAFGYHLTYSATERWSIADVVSRVKAGLQVAVVVDVKRKEVMPNMFHGVPMVDGDLTDDRGLEGACVVGLRPKGKLVSRRHTSPMVFKLEESK